MSLIDLILGSGSYLISELLRKVILRHVPALDFQFCVKMHFFSNYNFQIKDDVTMAMTWLSNLVPN